MLISIYIYIQLSGHGKQISNDTQNDEINDCLVCVCIFFIRSLLLSIYFI